MEKEQNNETVRDQSDQKHNQKSKSNNNDQKISKESDNEEVSVRVQGEGDVGKFKLDEFVAYFNSLLTKE